MTWPSARKCAYERHVAIKRCATTNIITNVWSCHIVWRTSPPCTTPHAHATPIAASDTVIDVMTARTRPRSAFFSRSAHASVRMTARSQSVILMTDGSKMAVPTHVSGVSHLPAKIAPSTSGTSASHTRMNAMRRGTSQPTNGLAATAR